MYSFDFGKKLTGFQNFYELYFGISRKLENILQFNHKTELCCSASDVQLHAWDLEAILNLATISKNYLFKTFESF